MRELPLPVPVRTITISVVLVVVVTLVLAGILTLFHREPVYALRVDRCIAHHLGSRWEYLDEERRYRKAAIICDKWESEQ